MMHKIMNFIKDEDGVELSEYAIMGALIVIALVAAIVVLQESIIGAFERIAGEIAAA